MNYSYYYIYTQPALLICNWVTIFELQIYSGHVLDLTAAYRCPIHYRVRGGMKPQYNPLIQASCYETRIALNQYKCISYQRGISDAQALPNTNKRPTRHERFLVCYTDYVKSDKNLSMQVKITRSRMSSLTVNVNRFAM
jgi:hypothetical protein